MNKQQLYDSITDRKIKQKDFEEYDGNNGRVNKCVDLFKKGVLNTGGTILDVGGGIGDLGCALRDSFDRRICLDISQKNLEAAKAKGNLTIHCDIDSGGISNLFVDGDKIGAVWEPETDGQVDVVTALDFIEHIIDPEYFARECYRVLKSGGQVFINTPNIQHYKHLEKLIFSEKFPQTSGDTEVWGGGHLSFFTFGDLKEMFEKAGFVNCRRIRDDETYSNPPEWLMNNVKHLIKNQNDYVDFCEKFGNSNLLFLCKKNI